MLLLQRKWPTGARGRRQRLAFTQFSSKFLNSGCRNKVLQPYDCTVGRVEAYDPQTAEEAAKALLAGVAVYVEPTNLDAWATFADTLADLYNEFDYLRIEGPSHILRGSSHCYKADMFDALAYAQFHKSEDGFVGKDKSNFEASSYLYMTFKDVHGFGMSWVSRGDLGSAKGV